MLLNPSHSWKVHHTQKALLCQLRSLTPHTPGEFTTPIGLFLSALILTPSHSSPHPQGSFVSATLLNPSHSWRVHHTHRAVLCRLRSLTPHTPGEYTTPTGLFCVNPHPQGSFVSATLLNPHTPGKYTTPTGLFCVGYAP